jgi:hypothetical protein
MERALSRSSRAVWLAWLLGAPALVGALWIAATEMRAPNDASTSEPPFASMAAAIQHGEVEDAYAFITAGADANAPIPFSDPELTADHPVMLSPLLLAVSANKENTVMMLLSFGARLDLPQNELAPCLARRLGYSNLAAMIVRDGKAPRDITCPEPQPAPQAPLLAYVK